MFLCISETVEMRTDVARCAYMHAKIEEAIRENKNVWKELRQLGILSFFRSELHGFTTEEINSYFSSISICPNEEYSNSHNLINSASTNRFSFKPVTIQIAGKRRDGILQSIIAKALHHHHQTSALSFCYSFS